MNKYQLIMETALQTLLAEYIADQEPFNIIVPTTDNWEFPLHSDIVKKKSIVLAFSGWALEQVCLVGHNGLYVKLAFGDDENSKTFSLSEVHAVLTNDGSALYQRVFDSTETKEEYTLKSLIGMPPNSSPEGVKNSMNAMKKNNPGAFDKKEKK